MIWDRSETIALAKMNCNDCRSLGLCKNSTGAHIPCTCVLRAIFKICHRRFKSASMQGKRVSTVKLERSGSGQSSHMYFSRKNEEYIADFQLTARRVLTPEQYKLFRFHYLLGAEVKLVAAQVRMTHDNLLHHYSRMEITLGRAFRETEPFPLFPLDEYFSDTQRGGRVQATSSEGKAA